MRIGSESKNNFTFGFFVEVYLYTFYKKFHLLREQI